jgi:hypothetical protein
MMLDMSEKATMLQVVQPSSTPHNRFGVAFCVQWQGGSRRTQEDEPNQ